MLSQISFSGGASLFLQSGLFTKGLPSSCFRGGVEAFDKPVCVKTQNKCPVVAPALDSRVLWVNALTLEFVGLHAHGYSPQQIISKILTGVHPDLICSLILVAPVGPNQYGFRCFTLWLWNLLFSSHRGGTFSGSQLVVVVVVVYSFIMCKVMLHISMHWLTIPLRSIITLNSLGDVHLVPRWDPLSWCCSLCLSLRWSLFGRKNTVLLGSLLG